MIRRVTIGLLAFSVLAAGAFVTYGWWTRRGAPEFTRGGAFRSPASEAQPSTSSSGPAAARVRGRTTTKPATETVRGPAADDTRGPVHRIARPVAGTYTYQGSGTERVRFGPTSACSWEIDEVTAVVKRARRGAIFDWTYSSQRLERHVYRYDERTVALEFVGAAVTCLGVRQTSEDEYVPPAVWVSRPWDVGHSWSYRSRAGGRVEETTERVAAREVVRVPAGRFVAYRIESSTQISGDSSGTHRGTNWFVPALGINVKRISEVDVQHGSAQFDSSITLELASLP